MPLYENDETLARENATRIQIEERLGVSFRKLPIQYSLDWAAVDSQNFIRHWAELKNRDFEHTRYPNYVLSFEKILKARELSSATGVPSWLFLAFTDGAVLEMRLDDVENWQPKWGGRTVKTRRKADIHPVVHIPRDWFTRII